MSDVRHLAAKYKAVLDHLRALPKTREQALAITALEESAFRGACAAEMVSDPIASLCEKDG